MLKSNNDNYYCFFFVIAEKFLRKYSRFYELIECIVNKRCFLKVQMKIRVSIKAYHEKLITSNLRLYEWVNQNNKSTPVM